MLRNKIFILFLGAFLFRAVLAFFTWHPDVNNHVDWGIRFWEYGPKAFYDQNVWSFSWPNQPPGTMLIFAFIRRLHEVIFSFFWWLNINIPLFPSNIMFFLEERLYPALLKLPAILADLGITYLILSFFRKQRKEKLGILGAAIFLWNPVSWYSSSLWGQTDSTINFFGLLALLLLLEKRLIFAVLAFTLSLFIKLSLVILLPVFLILALRQKHPISVWVKSVTLAVLIVGALTFPFSGTDLFSWLFELYKDKVFGWQLHIITANAFNLWAALTGIHERLDTLLLGPLSFKTWGYILFGAVLIPLLVKIYKKHDASTILWVTALTIFSSFILLTGIHERYLYPLFPILTILVAQQRKLLFLLVVVSAIHLINLYNFWWYPRIEPLVNLLSAGDRLLPRILGGAMTVLFVWFYVSFFKSWKTVK